MTARTSEILAKALYEAGLEQLAEEARKDMFHDYLSPHSLPELELEQALRTARNLASDPQQKEKIEAVRQRLLDGDFDADTAESEDWARSKEGQDTFNQLMREDDD